MTDKSLGDREEAWMQVAETMGSLEAEVIASSLRTADIPVYIESVLGIPSIFGHLGDPRRVFVPERYYEAALDLLDNLDDLPGLEPPGIQL